MLQGPRLNKRYLIGITLYASTRGILAGLVVYVIYAILGVTWVRIPWMPISVIGIAVSFYVSFKNNASYDRFWEGRKIWGGIVNESRSWASAVLCYVLPGDESDQAKQIRQTLIYRHLAWINALRLQLRSTSYLFNKPTHTTKKRLERHDDHMRNDWNKELEPFLSEAELESMTEKINPATHLVHAQGEVIKELQGKKGVDLFHQIALMGILRELYTLQGKAERIKKTPFPRQYAETSRIFVKVFIWVIPFGLLDVFATHFKSQPSWETVGWLAPYLIANALITWVFMTMEGVGSASENPFDRTINDVPMNALCRVIERDLRQMIGEEDLPDVEHAKEGILY